MKTCVLHIGSGKTGSSSIQRALSKYIQVDHAKYIYPKIGNRQDNQVFRLAFCNLENTPINFRSKYRDKADEFRDWQESILHEFKEKTNNSKDIIISSEFLFLSGEKKFTQSKDF